MTDEQWPALRDRLAGLLQLHPKGLDQARERGTGKDGYRIPLVNGLQPEQVLRFQEQNLDLPGASVDMDILRFYPEVVWDSLSEEERTIKDGSVEMFLKSLELISTFNPELTAGQLLELERKMAVTKKKAFEHWVGKSLRRRSQEEKAEKRRFSRQRWVREWREWLADPTTGRALLPLTGLILTAGILGWHLGSQQFSRELILQPGVQRSR